MNEPPIRYGRHPHGHHPHRQGMGSRLGLIALLLCGLGWMIRPAQGIAPATAAETTAAETTVGEAASRAGASRQAGTRKAFDPGAVARDPTPDAAALRREARSIQTALRPLALPMPAPGPHDWLSVHEEPGQSLQAYLAAGPVTAWGRRRVIYIQPLGPFSTAQRRVLERTAVFLGLYFGLPARIRPDLPATLIPAKARRFREDLGQEQINSVYILDKVLRPRLPRDGAAYIALTAIDLYPEDDWNFVFGQASTRHRVGVFSLARNGDPDAGAEAYRTCLLRTVKTASHEMGHMFSMLHCIEHHCNLNGSNNRAESDAQPLWLCPSCTAKLLYATGAEPIARAEALLRYAREEGFEPETAYFEAALPRLRAALGKPAASPAPHTPHAPGSSAAPTPTDAP